MVASKVAMTAACSVVLKAERWVALKVDPKVVSLAAPKAGWRVGATELLTVVNLAAVMAVMKAA